jgi:glycine/D-amino acid oxidase-like deaminating enzyme
MSPSHAVGTVKRAGGRFHGSMDARQIKGGKTASVSTSNKKKITADAVVVAANTP